MTGEMDGEDLTLYQRRFGRRRKHGLGSLIPKLMLSPSLAWERGYGLGARQGGAGLVNS